MSMKDLAHHIIGVAQAQKVPVTNLQLQKVMYFSIQYWKENGTYDNNFLNQTYDKPFLVWRYGPVEKDIYEVYRVYGSDPIIEECPEDHKFSRLNPTIIRLLKTDPFKLVERSHRESFWREHQAQINGWRSDVQYQLSDIGGTR